MTKSVEIIITDSKTGDVERLVAPKVKDVGFKAHPPERHDSFTGVFRPIFVNEYYDVYFGFRALPENRYGTMFTLYKKPPAKPTRKPKSRKKVQSV